MNFLIIIGTFLTIFTYFGAASGYLLILLGIISHRPLKEIKAAKKILVALAVLELISSFVPLPYFLFRILDNFLTALPVYLYYLLIKAEYMWSPKRSVALFLKRYNVIGLIYLLFVGLNSLTDSLIIMRLVISSTYYTYLFYIFMSLYLKNPSRKRLSIPWKNLRRR